MDSLAVAQWISALVEREPSLTQRVDLELVYRRTKSKSCPFSVVVAQSKFSIGPFLFQTGRNKNGVLMCLSVLCSYFSA